jgi:hypothetical protein
MPSLIAVSINHRRTEWNYYPIKRIETEFWHLGSYKRVATFEGTSGRRTDLWVVYYGHKR